MNQSNNKPSCFPLIAVLLFFLLMAILGALAIPTRASALTPEEVSMHFQYGYGGGECFAKRAEGELVKSPERFCTVPGKGNSAVSLSMTPATLVRFLTETLTPTLTPTLATETPVRNDDEVPTQEITPTSVVNTPTETTPIPTEVTQIVTETPVLETPTLGIPTKTPDPEPYTVTPKVPTETPAPPPVEPTKKIHCNNGEGNGGEGCSPSDNGNNDED